MINTQNLLTSDPAYEQSGLSQYIKIFQVKKNMFN